MYTIGQVAEMFDLPISTLRYYDKQGLFPQLTRESGIRKFSDNEIEALRVIECLKNSGLEIKDIKLFMEWCAEGSATYSNRFELIHRQKERVETEIQQLHKTLDMLTYKCWYYTQAMKDGSEDTAKALTPDGLPEDIRRAYDHSHNQFPVHRLQNN